MLLMEDAVWQALHFKHTKDLAIFQKNDKLRGCSIVLIQQQTFLDKHPIFILRNTQQWQQQCDNTGQFFSALQDDTW